MEICLWRSLEASFRISVIPITAEYRVVLPRWVSVVKNPPADAGDMADAGLTPGLGKTSGGGNCNPLQYSCLENSMDRGAWKATVHGATKEWDTTEWLTNSNLRVERSQTSLSGGITLKDDLVFNQQRGTEKSCISLLLSFHLFWKLIVGITLV